MLRWRVLASRKFTVREADLILGGESLMKLMTLMWELMWESSKKPLTLFVCAIWVGPLPLTSYRRCCLLLANIFIMRYVGMAARAKAESFALANWPNDNCY